MIPILGRQRDRAGEEPGELGVLRTKLLKFLDTSKHYAAEEHISSLPMDGVCVFVCLSVCVYACACVCTCVCACVCVCYKYVSMRTFVSEHFIKLCLYEMAMNPPPPPPPLMLPTAPLSQTYLRRGLCCSLVWVDTNWPSQSMPTS